jgi:hypothetical protein
VLLTYVDESYDKSNYWITALIVPEREARSLTAALDAVVAKAFMAWPALSLRAELHGHALFHGKDDWTPVETRPRVRIGVYNDAFAALADHDVQIIQRGVNIRRLNARYDYPDHPHAVVLAHLLERVDEYADRMDEWAIVIADEIDEAAIYRQNLWHFQQYATPGYRARRIERIVDTIHFAPSSASRLLQAADLISYMNFRMLSNADRDDRAIAANTALWSRLNGKIYHHRCWHP